MDKKEPGYVYILTNPSFREDWVKIGKSSRPVDVRSKELDNTAVPLPFEVFATMKTQKYNEAEKLVHRYIERFTNLRIRNNREFFNVKPEDALEIFKDVALVLEDAEIEETYKKENVGENEKENNLRGCFEKYGEMYWTQHFNFRKGDTGYIYSSSPDSAIIFSIEVVDAELKYDSIMDFKEEFFVDKDDFDTWKQHNRFARFRMTGKTNSSRLNLAHLMSHGLKMAPRGALNLSYKDYEELKKYIEDNF